MRTLDWWDHIGFWYIFCRSQQLEWMAVADPCMLIMWTKQHTDVGTVPERKFTSMYAGSIPASGLYNHNCVCRMQTHQFVFDCLDVVLFGVCQSRSVSLLSWARKLIACNLRTRWVFSDFSGGMQPLQDRKELLSSAHWYGMIPGQSIQDPWITHPVCVGDHESVSSYCSKVCWANVLASIIWTIHMYLFVKIHTCVGTGIPQHSAIDGFPWYTIL